MKLKTVKITRSTRVKKTNLTLDDIKTTDGKIVLTHHQTIRQSAGYQSAEVSYGGTITVEANTKTVRNAKLALEATVEDALVTKLSEQRDVLTALVKANRT